MHADRDAVSPRHIFLAPSARQSIQGYNFITQHPEWGSNEKVDRQHWARFPAYKPSKPSSRPDAVAKDWMQKEHLFMRWKEYFLVPDHRVKTISGASFEGFYYISFNQVSGSIEGIYFHAKSEK